MTYSEAHSVPPKYLGILFIFMCAAQCVLDNWSNSTSPSGNPHGPIFLRLTVCVSGGGVGLDSAGEQKKLEARKLLEKRADSPPSTARCVRQL